MKMLLVRKDGSSSIVDLPEPLPEIRRPERQPLVAWKPEPLVTALTPAYIVRRYRRNLYQSGEPIVYEEIGVG